MRAVNAAVDEVARRYGTVGHEEPESENTEPKYPEPESTGLARLNLNVLSKPSGNLQLYECLPSARLKVRNRFSKRNEKT